MTRIANDNPINEDGDIKDNIILPFQLQESGLRGRAIRLGDELNAIISAHDYPPAISHLLADTITLAVALSSMLKYDGIFTLQASGKGAVKTLVADMTHEGHIRGCATFDKETLDALKPSDNGIYDGYTLPELLGEGYIAFTVDQGDNTERYQGIVSLEGESLQDSIVHYFEQSEQLRTSLYIAARKDADNQWHSGALMLQYLPDDHAQNDGDVVSFNDKEESERKEDWRRSKTLLQTCTDDEILNKKMHTNELLRRLFHEEGVIVYETKDLRHQCRCSQDRVQHVVDGLSDDDRQHAAKDGKIEMTCEFCSKTYIINA
jgi:molecular chaperone Hsp33